MYEFPLGSGLQKRMYDPLSVECSIRVPAPARAGQAPILLVGRSVTKLVIPRGIRGNAGHGSARDAVLAFYRLDESELQQISPDWQMPMKLAPACRRWNSRLATTDALGCQSDDGNRLE